MNALRSRPFVPLDAFLELDSEPGTRLEWCAGFVHAMSGGSPAHSRLGARVIVLLSALEGEDCTVFDANADLWVEAAQFYGQADASVVCGAVHTHKVTKKEKPLGEAVTNPVIVVEVLSPSSEVRDRGEKFAAYKQIPSLREYVLVAQDERRVEIRRRGEHGWSSEIAVAGEAFLLHGREVLVDAIYR